MDVGLAVAMLENNVPKMMTLILEGPAHRGPLSRTLVARLNRAISYDV